MCEGVWHLSEVSWAFLTSGSAGTNLLKARQLPVQADPERRTGAQGHGRGPVWLQEPPCDQLPRLPATSCRGLSPCPTPLQGHKSRCGRGGCILSRHSVHSDARRKVRPVTHPPKMRVRATEKSRQDRPGWRHQAPFPPSPRPSHMPTLNHAAGHIPSVWCLRVLGHHFRCARFVAGMRTRQQSAWAARKGVVSASR